MKRRMHLISSETKTELKQNVYRNHTKFIETAKEVSSLESEVYQLHSLLADEKQLLNTVKELLNVDKKVTFGIEESDFMRIGKQTEIAFRSQIFIGH